MGFSPRVEGQTKIFGHAPGCGGSYHDPAYMYECKQLSDKTVTRDSFDHIYKHILKHTSYTFIITIVIHANIDFRRVIL